MKLNVNPETFAKNSLTHFLYPSHSNIHNDSAEILSVPTKYIPHEYIHNKVKMSKREN